MGHRVVTLGFHKHEITCLSEIMYLPGMSALLASIEFANLAGDVSQNLVSQMIIVASCRTHRKHQAADSVRHHKAVWYFAVKKRATCTIVC